MQLLCVPLIREAKKMFYSQLHFGKEMYIFRTDLHVVLFIKIKLRKLHLAGFYYKNISVCTVLLNVRILCVSRRIRDQLDVTIY